MSDIFNSSSLVLNNATELQKNLINFAGNQLIYIIVGLFLIYLIFKLLNQGLNIIKLSVFALPIIYLLYRLTNYFVNTPSPYITDNFTPLLQVSNKSSFPSEYTMWIVAIGLIVFSESKIIGGILFIIAGIVGYSTILGGANRIEDVLASFAISIVGMIIAKVILNFLEKKN